MQWLSYLIVVFPKSDLENDHWVVAWRYSQVPWTNLAQNIGSVRYIASDQGLIYIFYFVLLFWSSGFNILTVSQIQFNSCDAKMWRTLYEKLCAQQTRGDWVSEEFKRVGLWSLAYSTQCPSISVSYFLYPIQCPAQLFVKALDVVVYVVVNNDQYCIQCSLINWVWKHFML